MIARQRAAGFSLVEVMVAILILGVALAGLTHGIGVAFASNKDAELLTVAALFADGKIETLRAERGMEDGETGGDCGTTLPLYRWRQKVTATEIAGLHEVSVKVLHSRTGDALFELKTLLFEPLDDETTKSTAKSKDTEKSKDSKSKRRRGGAA